MLKWVRSVVGWSGQEQVTGESFPSVCFVWRVYQWNVLPRPERVRRFLPAQYTVSCQTTQTEERGWENAAGGGLMTCLEGDRTLSPVEAVVKKGIPSSVC